MTDNNLYVMNSPKAKNLPIAYKNINQSTAKQQSNIKQDELSFVSTEINSNKKIEIEENGKKNHPKVEAIKTFCRIRPIKEKNELFSISPKDEGILKINSSNLEKLNVGNNLKLINSYKFSKVFGEDSTQEDVFELTCKPLIEDLITKQRSSLIFTYGMTNAGKTFTVIGTPENPGILPQALKNLIEYDENKNIKNDKASRHFYCNFVEIYNEEVFDLLADDPTKKNKFFKKKLNIKENLNSIFFLQDVTYAKLDNLESFNNILNKGIAKKVHSSTNLNQNSSRSHTIFKIILMNNNKDISKIDFSTEELISLSVVDLAGSERQKRTDAKGKNLQEACKINQSLSTLGKCLEAMKHNSISNIKKIVPLRESKLTKLFAEYFQGDQNIIMITNINPRNEDFEETIRALNYSCIAKDIKPIKSIIPKLNSGNELKLQLKKEKKLMESFNIANINSDTNALNDVENNIQEEKPIVNPISIVNNNNIYDGNRNENLNDSLTFNLNELFNSNIDDINNKELKTEITHPPEDNSSTKDEIAKLMLEIKKLREEVFEFKSENSEVKKNKEYNSESKSESKLSKSIIFDKNKIELNNNNVNPFGNETNIDINNTSFNRENAIIAKENNDAIANSGIFPGINNQNNNSDIYSTSNMIVPYGGYGYPLNNPFVPFYGLNNFNSPFLPLSAPNIYNRNGSSLITPGKGNNNMKKNKKINDILNSALNNIYPGLQSGYNLIFINSRFGNFKPPYSTIEEENSYSSDEEDLAPKKRKVKGTPKRKKKNNKNNKIQKYYGKSKLGPQKINYPKQKKNNNISDRNKYNTVIENYDEDDSFSSS